MDASGRTRLMTEGIEIPYETYGSSYYIRCPQCEAKNIAIRRNLSRSSPELDIVTAVIDDE